MKQIFYFWLFQAVSLHYFVTSSFTNTTNDPIEWICPDSYNGNVRHPYNCQYFYVCSPTKKPTFLICYSNLYFNPITKMCDNPDKVPDCEGGSPPPISSTPTPSTTSPPTTRDDPGNWICPEGYHGLIRHPTDCLSFYLCNVRDTPYLLECSNGLYFNPEIQSCDFPENVPDCQGGTPPPTSTTAATTTTSDPINWVCSEGYHGLIRHPNECLSFYLCNANIVPYQFECPLGLYFNPETGRCDFPANVPDCVGGSPRPNMTTEASTITSDPIS